MKASQLIQQLAQAISIQGDNDVIFTNINGETIFDKCCVEHNIKGSIEVYLTKR